MPSPLRRAGGALLVVAALSTPSLAQARVPPTSRIVEGRSIGGVAIGDARAKVVRLWGPPTDRCRRIPAWDGTTCQERSYLTVTYDGTGHVAGIDSFYRVNVTQRHVVGNARFGVFATRAGIGATGAQNTMLKHYGKRASLLPRRLEPGFGGVNRTWIVRGPAGRVTLFGVVGANRGARGGQITHVTIARELAPAVTGPARLGFGEVPPVSADGLVPGLPYRFEVDFPGAADPVPLASVRADAAGHAAASIAYDGPLALQLATDSTAASGDVAGTLRVVGLDGVEPPEPGQLRVFWLGPLVTSAPLAVAAPQTTMTVEPASPVSFDTALTVRFGGVAPTTLQGDQSPGLSYELVFEAPCGDNDQHVFQDPVAGVLSLPGASDRSSPQRSVRSACSGLPAGQPVTVPLTLYRDIDLKAGLTKRITAASVPITFTRP